MSPELDIIIPVHRAKDRLAMLLKSFEVGVDCGRSLGAMAEALPADGRVWGVDPWNVEGRFDQAREVAVQDDRIELVRGYSVDVALGWPHGDVDMVHVDGDHAADSVFYDIVSWAMRVKQDGIIVGHDWHLPRVRLGVMWAVHGRVFKMYGLGQCQRWGIYDQWWGIVSDRIRLASEINDLLGKLKEDGTWRIRK
jgi:hypothetical protein